MKRLTVLNVAYPLAPVGPDAVGGAEQVIAILDRALTERGHRSMVLAGPGSEVAGELISTPRFAPPFTPELRGHSQCVYRQAIRRVLDHDGIDVVHLHGVDFYHYAPSEVPVLVTLHLPPSWYPQEVLAQPASHMRFICVSRSQSGACPSGETIWRVIENGVRLGPGHARYAKRRFAMGMGRICPEKGFHIGMDAAAEAGYGFVLAGQVYPYPEHERYFRDEIAPRLGPGRRFVGPLRMGRKRRFVSAATCLVVASQVSETSSLVAMEAMACGTPVVAFRNGALAEIVEDGCTGFLVSNREEMAEAIGRASALDTDDCRHAAGERFSADRTAARYIDAYERLATEERGSM